jgi:hypothetical protein
VLKNKSLVIVSILVLVLAVVAMACAPAAPAKPAETPAAPPAAPETPAAPPAAPETPAAPPAAPATPAAPAPEIVTSFEAATYTSTDPAFSIKYPKTWVAGDVKLDGGKFYAKGGDDLVYVAVRPATNFKDAASTFLADLIKLSGVALSPSVDSEKTVTFLDGSQGNEIMLSALFGSKKATVYGVIKDGKAIMVMCGTQPKSLALYSEIGKSLVVK